MLKLTRKADYGLISLKHMAMKQGCASAREISDTYGIPLPLLAKVLQTLARKGFVQSEHGANGGYRLRIAPGEITALAVIKSIDGPVFLTSCVTAGSECGVGSRCNVREPLRKVHTAIEQLLESMTIADMCESEETAASGDCGTPHASPLSQIIAVQPGV